MKMKNMIAAIGAALAAMIGASPASAAIYEYTTGSNAGPNVLTINTKTLVATFKGGDADMTFTSADFANFKGGATPSFVANFSSISGTQIWNGVKGSVINTDLSNVGRGAPRIDLAGVGISIRGIDWTSLKGFDLTWTVTGYKVIEADPVTVPEPAMLGLFGAGAMMVMMGRRRRSSGKYAAGIAQGAPRLAMA